VEVSVLNIPRFINDVSEYFVLKIFHLRVSISRGLLGLDFKTKVLQLFQISLMHATRPPISFSFT
jgi:hypothetical protein